MTDNEINKPPRGTRNCPWYKIITWENGHKKITYYRFTKRGIWKGTELPSNAIVREY